jgi:hypothetical protein
MSKGKAWTDEEIMTLRRMILAGASNRLIAVAIGRSVGAIEAKIGVLGYLTLRSPNFDPSAEPPIAGELCRISTPDAEWDLAWKLHHGDRRYEDHKRALPPQDAPRLVRSYGCNFMTMGGVASY